MEGSCKAFVESIISLKNGEIRQTKVLEYIQAHDRDHINTLDKDGYNLLHYACGNKLWSVVDCLLDEKVADASITTARNQSALLFACWKASEIHIPILRKLIDAGCSPSIADFEGLTPLHQAAHSSCLAVVKMLLEYPGVKIDCQNDQGQTPLMLAVERTQAFESHIGVADLLARKSQDINALDKSKESALFQACKSSRTPKMIIDSLMQNGANPMLANNRGKTSVEIATQSLNCAGFRALLSYCFEKDILASSDLQPLMSLAVTSHRFPIVKELVARDAVLPIHSEYMGYLTSKQHEILHNLRKKKQILVFITCVEKLSRQHRAPQIASLPLDLVLKSLLN